FPQMAVYSFGFLLIHELIAFTEHRRWRTPLLLGAALLLGTMIAWPQVSTTLELVGRSVREGESAAFAMWGSVPPPGVVSLLFPQWGQALRISLYIGFVPLFLVSALFFLKA